MQTQSAADIPIIQPEQAAALAEQLIEKLEKAENQGASRLIARLNRGDFEYGGLRFSFTRHDHADGTKLQIKAEIGFLPFTAEGKTKRAALVQILQSAHKLHHVRLACDKQGQMQLHATVMLGNGTGDVDVIMALLPVFQEINPVLGLIARYI